MQGQDHAVDAAVQNRDDATRFTSEHIRKVGLLMSDMVYDLMRRAVVHDSSKWDEEEWEGIGASTVRLKHLTYGTEEYKRQLADLKPYIDHHYKSNSHHPEYYPNGVDDMDLLDVLEMLCDWKAATERHNDGDLTKSFEINGPRFNISPQLLSIMKNTARRRGWIS